MKDANVVHSTINLPDVKFLTTFLRKFRVIKLSSIVFDHKIQKTANQSEFVLMV